MSKFKKILVVVLCIFTVVVASFCFWLSDKYVVPIIMYHSINYSYKPVPNVTSPERFAWHMNFLKRHKYNVISLDQLVTAIKEGRPLSRKSVVITFDDGYRDNYIHAFEILKSHGFPAIIFIPPEQVGDEEYLMWNQIKEMNKYGIVAGSHTLDQTYLPDTSRDEQERQIKGSKAALERRLGHQIDYFAYPSGGFSEEIIDIVKKAGYKGACATNRGYDSLNKDVYQINRVRFSDKDNSAVILWAKLSGYYNLFREAKSSY